MFSVPSYWVPGLCSTGRRELHDSMVLHPWAASYHYCLRSFSCRSETAAYKTWPSSSELYPRRKSVFVDRLLQDRGNKPGTFVPWPEGARFRAKYANASNQNEGSDNYNHAMGRRRSVKPTCRSEKSSFEDEERHSTLRLKYKNDRNTLKCAQLRKFTYLVLVHGLEPRWALRVPPCPRIGTVSYRIRRVARARRSRPTSWRHHFRMHGKCSTPMFEQPCRI